MTRTRRLAKCILREYASPPKTWSYLTLYHYDLHLQVLPGCLAPKVPTAGHSQLDYSQPQGVYLTWSPWTVWQEAVDVCRTKESCFAGDSELWLCPLRRPLLCDCVHFRDRHGQTWLGWHNRWEENEHDDLDLRPWQKRKDQSNRTESLIGTTEPEPISPRQSLCSISDHSFWQWSPFIVHWENCSLISNMSLRVCLVVWI